MSPPADLSRRSDASSPSLDGAARAASSDSVRRGESALIDGGARGASAGAEAGSGAAPRIAGGAAQLLQRLNLSDRQIRVARVVGYAGFGLVTFLIALVVSLPRDRLRERLERELSQDTGPTAPLGTGMDVTIGDLGLHLFSPGVRASDIVMKPRQPPVMTGEQRPKLAAYLMDVVDLQVPLLGLVVGRRGVEAEVQAFGGTVTARAGLGGGEGSARVRAEQLVVPRIPGVSQAVPIPIQGVLSLSVDVKGPLDKTTQRPVIAGLSGQGELTLDDCVLGDGKAKLVVPGDPFLSQGLTFPKVQLGKIIGKVVVDKGRLTIAELRAKSADAEASLEGYIELRDPLPFSELHLYLRFRPTPALSQREATISTMDMALSGTAKRPDGFFGFALTGTFGVPVGRPAKEPPPGVNVRPGPSLGAVRPGGLGPGPGGSLAQRGPPPSPPPADPPPPPPPQYAPPSTLPPLPPPPPNVTSPNVTSPSAVQQLPPPPSPPIEAVPPPPPERHDPPPTPDSVDPRVNLPPSYPIGQKGE